MSKEKYGYATKQESRELLTRDQMALANMKLLEESYGDRLQKALVGTVEVTTSNKLEKSPMLNYVKTKL